MSQSDIHLCENCNNKPAMISKARFNKQLAFCSGYCKSKHGLKYGLIGLFITLITFVGVELSLESRSFTIFTWIIIVVLLLELYNIVSNYLVVRNHGLYDTLK